MSSSISIIKDAVDDVCRCDLLNSGNGILSQHGVNSYYLEITACFFPDCCHTTYIYVLAMKQGEDGLVYFSVKIA